MNKSTKFYRKALMMYHSGEINKSLILCEKSISCNLRNSSAVNLKGLLYYLMGDMQSARVLWLMNKQENGDKVSEKYLEGLNEDKERLDIYHAAVKLLEELEVNAALELFEKCSESDFNAINVSNYRSLCYIKKGEYKRAKECIDKVLQLDKHNKIALHNKRTLEEYGITRKKADFKPYIIITAGVIIAASLLTLGKYIIKNMNSTAGKSSLQQQIPQVKSKKTQNTASVQNIQQDIFPYSEMNLYIDNKNYDGLYNDLMKWKDKSLQATDKTLMDKAVAVLKTDGSNYMYNTAMKLKKAGNQKEARDYFLKAYNFNSGSYLKEHIIYMLGATSENLGDIENQLKYYTEYIDKYPEGTYAPTVYYKLAMCYKDKNNSQAISYAQKLHDQYPDSIYNNDKLKALLQQGK